MLALGCDPSYFALKAAPPRLTRASAMHIGRSASRGNNTCAEIDPAKAIQRYSLSLRSPLQLGSALKMAKVDFVAKSLSIRDGIDLPAWSCYAVF
jgi:hypothetical protein